MVSTIAATLFLSAMTLAIWAIAHSLRSHADQIRYLMNPAKYAGVALAHRRRPTHDVRRPVTVTPLRRSPMRAAA